jgi:hypothetical protein
MGDILTDTFRALILRLAGYRTDVIEFVSPEHTDKNLMIRAVRGSDPWNPQAVREYRELRRFLQVTPHLEQLLADEIGPRLRLTHSNTVGTMDAGQDQRAPA